MSSQQGPVEWLRQYRQLEQHLAQYNAQVERIEEDIRVAKSGRDILNRANERIHVANDSSRFIVPAIIDLVSLVRVSKGLQRDERQSQLRQLERMALEITKRLNDCNREAQLEYGKIKRSFTEVGATSPQLAQQVQLYRQMCGGSNEATQQRIDQEISQLTDDFDVLQVVFSELSALISKHDDRMTRSQHIVNTQRNVELEMRDVLSAAKVRDRESFRRRCVVVSVVFIAVGLLCLAILILVGIRR